MSLMREYLSRADYYKIEGYAHKFKTLEEAAISRDLIDKKLVIHGYDNSNKIISEHAEVW